MSRVALSLLLPVLLTYSLRASDDTWRFVVSGDSRNCGDVVMPEIAHGATTEGAAFYWHLGDFRAIYDFDEDYRQTHTGESAAGAMTIAGYLDTAWNDFIQNQLEPFGALPVYLGIGNHELIPPKTRELFVAQFADWLDRPEIREQRLRDDPHDHLVKTYFHWRRDGIDFVSLDNASTDQFSSAQLQWIKDRVTQAAADDTVRALIVGMHEALPESLSRRHSMSDSLMGQDSGLKVYQQLLAFRATSKKPVYILASHSHFYMDGTFNTQYWREHGGVLPGWIIGTAGAVRYPLPPESAEAKAAKTQVYGYMTATVSADKTDPVHFDFHELAEADVLPQVLARFGADFVHTCWVANPALAKP